MAYTPYETPGYEITPFREINVANKTPQLALKPTWGISTLRYTTTTTGTGATVGESNGEFLLQSGTANNGLAQIQSNQRGQYQAGAQGNTGVGVRIPTAPTSTAFCEWGYTDFTNGYFCGVDSTGKYVALVTGGSTTKVYQTDWNIDKLDGTGASGLTLDLSKGTISIIEFTWYGYGVVEYAFTVKDPTTSLSYKIACHRIRVESAASIVDPNQPLTFRVGNGASGTTDTALYIGGHQFSSVGGEIRSPTRFVSELLTSYTTALNTNWQPLIAMRKTTNFNGRTNSLRIQIHDFLVAADADMQVRLTIGGTTSNLAWGTPTGWTATETGAETKVTGGTALTTSADGQPLQYGFVTATGTARPGWSSVVGSEFQTEFSLGAGQEMILWVRRLSAGGAMVVKHASLTWTEEW